MKALELPVLRAGAGLVAVVIENAEVACTPMTVVTVRESAHRPPHRRWYPDPTEALAYGAEQADRHGLPLIDLREPGE